MKQFLSLNFLLGLLHISFAQQLPNLPIPLGAGNAEVWNSEIYHFGGSNNWAGSIVYPRVYKFDGVNWAYHDSIPDYNLWDVETVLVGDYAYLLGGWPSGPSLNRRYDLRTGDWTYLAESPNGSQTWGITSEELNGIIYLFNSVGDVFAYDISNNSWLTKTSNSASGSWDMSSVLYQGEVYIIGWDDSSFYKYTPSFDQWTPLAKSPYQVGACAIGIINNLVYCVGGNEGGRSIADYKSIIIYDIMTNSWSIDTQELTSKRHWMATAEYEGGLYVIGGIDSLSQAVEIVEEIVPQGTAGVHKEDEIPDKFYLKQNYPNPFNPRTIINYELPITNYVELNIYNINGQKVATIVSGKQNVGFHSVEWDASGIASGVYYYRLVAGEYVATKKLVLTK